MRTLEIQYQDNLPDAARQSTAEFERELKMALASKLFELGRLSSGQAAELAGVPRYAFLHELSRYNVNAINWDPSEFPQELENA